MDTDEEEFKTIVKVNFMALWFLLKAVCKRMRDLKTGGSVVLLTSIMGGERGIYPGAAAYGSCLAGVQQLVRVCETSIIYVWVLLSQHVRNFIYSIFFPFSKKVLRL